VIADFGPRNVERLEIFRRIASSTGRELVVLPKDAHLLEAMRQADGVDRLDGVRIYDELRTREERYLEEVRGRNSGRMVKADEIADAPSSFILSFSFWDLGRMLDIRTEGGTYIYSSSEAFSEEQQIDFRRLSNWLHRLNMRAVGYRMATVAGREVPVMVPGYHASGHISGPEVLRLVRTIRPRAVMPIHTESPEHFASLADDGIEVIVPEEGRTYRL
jgi:ribonuclease J